MEVPPEDYKHVIFLSYTLSSVEIYYHIIEKEYLAIIRYLKEYR